MKWFGILGSRDVGLRIDVCEMPGNIAHTPEDHAFVVKRVSVNVVLENSGFHLSTNFDLNSDRAAMMGSLCMNSGRTIARKLYSNDRKLDVHRKLPITFNEDFRHSQRLCHSRLL